MTIDLAKIELTGEYFAMSMRPGDQVLRLCGSLLIIKMQRLPIDMWIDEVLPRLKPAVMTLHVWRTRDGYPFAHKYLGTYLHEDKPLHVSVPEEMVCD